MAGPDRFESRKLLVSFCRVSMLVRAPSPLGYFPGKQKNRTAASSTSPLIMCRRTRREAKVTKDYAVRLKCPYGDEDRWVNLRNREETLEQVLRTPWDFECPVHGVQREIPLDASETGSSASQRPQRMGLPKPGGLKMGHRRSKRLPLCLPVLVYGRARDRSFFKEEASTLLVNAHGGLIALKGRVGLGEAIFLVNNATQEEQECLVAYVGPGEAGKAKVGIAFKHSAPNFWRIDFPSAARP